MKLKTFIENFMRNKLAVVGLVGVLLVMFVGIILPIFIIYPSNVGELENVLLSPSPKFLFGTDNLGSNIFSQVVWGARTSLVIAVMAVVVSSTIGIPIGLISGSVGGIVTQILDGITEIFITLPMLPLLIVLAAVLNANIYLIAGIIGLFSWPSLARVTKNRTLVVSEMQYIEAAKSLGFSRLSVVFKQILPNISGPILVNITIVMATAIISEASISFLGLGDPSQWSWGNIILNSYRSGHFADAWWFSFFPSFSILIFVISFNFLGTGINEALNPRIND